MAKNSLLKIIFLFILSTINVVAQNDSVNLKDVWEDTKNADSVRFKALGDYYALNNQAHPVATLEVLDYYYHLAKEKNNTRELYNVANYRGGIYRLKGETDSAFKYYGEAQKLAEELNDFILKATILGNIGNVYAHKRDYTNALQYFSNSFKIFKRIKDIKGESHMLTNIGSVYLYIQNYDLALKYYQKALSIIKDIDVPQRRIAVIYLNIGWTNYELKEYKKAIPYYDKALKILELTNDKFFLVSCYSTLAKIHLNLEDIQAATYFAEKSIRISNELDMAGFITDGKIIFAQIELKKGNIESAKEMGESILEGIDINTAKDLKLNLFDLLYKVYQAENNSEKALEMYQKFTSYKDSIQLERNKLTLIREVVKNEFDDLLLQNEQNLLKEKAELESKQRLKTYIVSIISIILIVGIVFYFNRNLKRSRKKRDELLREIEMLKQINVNDLKVNSETIQPEQMEMDHFSVNSGSEKPDRKEVNKLPVNSNEFQLIREKIESSINRKLNTTDWNVLNILLKEPDISNKEIAEKAFMSVDGIGSSLRRMYVYFDIKESKYKKIALIMEAIKASS